MKYIVFWEMPIFGHSGESVFYQIHDAYHFKNNMQKNGAVAYVITE